MKWASLGLFREKERSVHFDLFPGWNGPISISGLCSPEVEHKLKSSIVEAGFGFGTGRLIITVAAEDH